MTRHRLLLTLLVVLIALAMFGCSTSHILYDERPNDPHWQPAATAAAYPSEFKRTTVHNHWGP